MKSLFTPSVGPLFAARNRLQLARGAAYRRTLRCRLRLWIWAAPLVALGLGACADMSGIASSARLRNADSLGLSPGAAPIGATQATAAQNNVQDTWWRAFGDAQLNGLVDKALANSPSLYIAQARLARAAAVTELADAALLPQVGGAVDLIRQRFTANGAVPPPLAGAVVNTGSAQINASWEIDFFGKYRAALDAALGNVNAVRADADAARLLLASNVVRSYFQWARTEAQLTVALRTLAQREQALALVRDRVRTGLDTQLEQRQSEGGLPEARQQIEALQEQAALTRNALAALIGEPNMPLAAFPPILIAIKKIAIPAVIPADLLGQRADIAAARWRVEAASKEVDVARTQFYPNINLAAFVGLSSIGLDNLARASSRQWGVGPALRLPIFEGGRLRANLRGKAADQDAAIESYNASVIDAVHDVADQLASSSSVQRQQAEQGETQSAAQDAYDIAVQRYRAGLATYIQVLAAETAVLGQRRLAVDLAARALDVQVGLARALGGGWQPDMALP